MQLQHRDQTPKKSLLVNREQEAVVDLVIEILEAKIKQCAFQDFTKTVIP